MDMEVKCTAAMSKYGFSYVHNVSRHPKDSPFKLHSHSGYEILIMLRGTADFVVEGTVYSIEPADIVMIHNNNMHRIYNIRGDEYERIVISMDDEFLEKNNCNQYAEIFKKRTRGDGNLLSGETVRKSEILPTIKRLEFYLNQNSDKNIIVSRCIFIELLHLLSEIKGSAGGEVRNETVKGVISYINENLSEPLRIDDLAEKFYISKYHLCRIFREYTGVTLKHYITCKRLLAVQNMRGDGRTLSDAALDAGFSSYSVFYKAYVKENGHSPKQRNE